MVRTADIAAPKAAALWWTRPRTEIRRTKLAATKLTVKKVRHGRGHYYDLYSICDTTGCRVPGRVRCALRLQFLDLRLPHSYSIVTLLFGLIVHIQLFALFSRHTRRSIQRKRQVAG